MEKINCKKCNQEISEEFNYCPYCGEPLSELAKQKEAIRLQNAGLLKLQELSNSTHDPAVQKAIKNLLKLK